MYSTIVFIHVVATLGIVVAMTSEAIMLRQLSGASTKGVPFELLTGSRVSSSICLLILFLSGGYLTERLSMWQTAWPKIAVAIVVVFGALAGVSGRRLKILHDSIQNSAGETRGTEGRTVDTSSFLTSLSLRTGLILAAVFLMTVKPKLVESVCISVALPLVCWLGAVFPGAKSRGPVAAKQSRPSTS